MEKVQVNKIENLKNILLVVLVLTTILLLYFLWGSKSIEAFIFNDNDEHYEKLESDEVIMPDQIILGKGNEDYSIITTGKEELWKNEILSTFINFSQDSNITRNTNILQGANILVEEITSDQYKAVMKYPSIIAKFEYNMPFTEFCEKYKIKQQQGYDSINCLTEIGFSKGSTESTFIFDGSKKKYYRLVGNKNLEICNKLDSIFTQQDFITYFPLKTFLGEESTNDILIPVEGPLANIPIEYKKDVEIGQKEITEIMAQKYFGKTFDFVRKVEESNGTTIYMYGYGQKVLIINPNEGSIEYKEEVKSNNFEQKSMFESLDIALDFVGSHGGFETIAGQKIKPYLESIMPIGDKKNSYQFVFSSMVGKNKLFYENRMPIIIDVIDGQVSYFRREFVNFDEIQAQKKSNEERISAINMLAMNYQYILTKSELIDKEDSKYFTFEDTANKISDLYTGYLKPAVVADGTIDTEKDLKLVPVWIVEVNGFHLYFDLYDGQPKGYSKGY